MSDHVVPAVEEEEKEDTGKEPPPAAWRKPAAAESSGYNESGASDPHSGGDQGSAQPDDSDEPRPSADHSISGSSKRSHHGSEEHRKDEPRGDRPRSPPVHGSSLGESESVVSDGYSSSGSAAQRQTQDVGPHAPITGFGYDICSIEQFAVTDGEPPVRDPENKRKEVLAEVACTRTGEPKSRMCLLI